MTPRLRSVTLILTWAAFAIIALPIVCSTAETAPNTLTPEETAQGWRLLFDGRTFAGWRGIGAAGIPAKHWIIEEGAVRKVAAKDVRVLADGQPAAGGDLITAETFQDFELAFEWKISPGGNSGIKYNVSEEMSLALAVNRAALGFEYQVLDDERHPDARNGDNRTAAALYDLMAPAGKTVRPAGQWNAARIVFRHGHGEHWLNGTKVLEFDVASPDFQKRLQASKYKSIPHFADQRKGHIVLQDHADAAWFRSLKIRMLDGTPQAEREAPAKSRSA